MSSDLHKAHLDFKDIDKDDWQIKWYSTVDDDSNRDSWFAIQEMKGDDSCTRFQHIELQNTPSLKTYLQNPAVPETMTEPATTQRTCWLRIPRSVENPVDILLSEAAARQLRSWIINVSYVDAMPASITRELKVHGDRAFQATCFEARAFEISPYRGKEENKWIDDHKHLFNAANPYTIAYISIV